MEAVTLAETVDRLVEASAPCLEEMAGGLAALAVVVVAGREVEASAVVAQVVVARVVVAQVGA